MKQLRVWLLALAAVSLSSAQDMSRMTTYAMVFLKRGPNWTAKATPEVQRIQQGHLDHLVRMTKEGKMLVAGPFTDGNDPQGICIYVTSAEEARRLAEEDPAVKAGRLMVEVRPWMAAKGIVVPDWTGK